MCAYADEFSGLLNYVFASISNGNPFYISDITKKRNKRKVMLAVLSGYPSLTFRFNYCRYCSAPNFI